MAKHCGLLYDMGNAGDLLKHGVLAEFVRWRCKSPEAEKPFRFLDPFGGFPWCKCCKHKIVGRINALGECALSAAQVKIASRCYYGSGHLACRAARAVDARIIVHASDGSPLLRRRLVRSGLLPLDFPGFKAECAYSVLESKLPPDGEILLLLDPFGDFLKCGIYQRVIPQIANVPPHVATMLFVLKENEHAREYERLRNKYLDGAWVMRCPPLIRKRDGGAIQTVKGETRHHVELLLIAPRLLPSPNIEELRKRLNCFAQKLAAVLHLPDEQAEMLKPKIIGRDA